ncbi:EamA domain-containing membrane protein RarD [Priestia megaterium]|nr:Uncharacterised protein [Streptococcus pneumoniae]
MDLVIDSLVLAGSFTVYYILRKVNSSLLE